MRVVVVVVLGVSRKKGGDLPRPRRRPACHLPSHRAPHSVVALVAALSVIAITVVVVAVVVVLPSLLLPLLSLLRCRLLRWKWWVGGGGDCGGCGCGVVVVVVVVGWWLWLRLRDVVAVFGFVWVTRLSRDQCGYLLP